MQVCGQNLVPWLHPLITAGSKWHHKNIVEALASGRIFQLGLSTQGGSEAEPAIFVLVSSSDIEKHS